MIRVYLLFIYINSFQTEIHPDQPGGFRLDPRDGVDTEEARQAGKAKCYFPTSPHKERQGEKFRLEPSLIRTLCVSNSRSVASV